MFGDSHTVTVKPNTLTQTNTKSKSKIKLDEGPIYRLTLVKWWMSVISPTLSFTSAMYQ